jgi:hypothetical protein
MSPFWQSTTPPSSSFAIASALTETMSYKLVDAEREG